VRCGVRLSGGCARACGPHAWAVASGVRCRARVRTPEIQVQTGPGVGLRGWRGRNDCQLTPPLRGKVNSKRLHRGQSQLAFAFVGGSTTEPTRATHSSPRHASHAPPPRTTVHLRRAQPCRRRLCRRAPSRTHALSHAAPAVSHASRLMLASPHTTCPRASAYYVLPRRPLLHHTLADI
jgi:hypothetical protein